MTLYYQSQQRSAAAIALFALTNQLMSATFFNELRTRKQYGYSVGTGYMPLSGYPGLIFYVQSNVVGPSEILEAMDEFIHQFPLDLLELNEGSWLQSKQALIAQIMDKDKTLQERSKRFWVSLGNGDFKFEQREKIGAEVERLTRLDVLKFIATDLKGIQSDRLVISAVGQRHSALDLYREPSEFDSIEAFQHKAGRLTSLRT